MHEGGGKQTKIKVLLSKERSCEVRQKAELLKAEQRGCYKKIAHSKTCMRCAKTEIDGLAFTWFAKSMNVERSRKSHFCSIGFNFFV